jgi:transcriptional regulator with XRE-family HTH domain
MRINGAALKLARENIGITMGQAADRVGVDQSSWSLWESGRREPTRQHVLAICDVLLIEDRTAILWPSVCRLCQSRLTAEDVA